METPTPAAEGSGPGSANETSLELSIRIIADRARLLTLEGRRLHLHYALARLSQPGTGPERYFVGALMWSRPAAHGHHMLEQPEQATWSDAFVLEPAAARALFDFLAGAQDPVLPVHVPDVVADVLSDDELLSRLNAGAAKTAAA
ncbi:MAG: hypothetical protein QJR08_06380 [Bacillota bacterium]|nr:hypothetical protein [Bacillota bacterium]